MCLLLVIAGNEGVVAVSGGGEGIVEVEQWGIGQVLCVE